MINTTSDGHVIKHKIYYRIARQKLEEAVQKSQIKEDGFKGALARDSQDELQIAVVFFYLALEAYINYYAVAHNIPNYEESNRCWNVKKKWKKYPIEACGKKLDQKYIDSLKDLEDARHNLVHYKPNPYDHRSKEGAEKFQENLLKVETVEEYKTAIDELFAELKRVDGMAPSILYDEK